MALVTFDDLLVGSDSGFIIPDGYADLNWDRFGAISLDTHFFNSLPEVRSGYKNVVESRPNVAFDRFGVGASILARDADEDGVVRDSEDFTILSGFFAAAWNVDLVVVFEGYDDGELVVSRTVELDRDKTFIEFGGFTGIDEFRYKGFGGTDAGIDGVVNGQNMDGVGRHLGVDNLEVDFFCEPISRMGGNARDDFVGGECGDRLSGRAGNDRLSGLDGNDLLDGGFGSDRLLGGAGSDTLIGNDGADVIEGEAGNDVISGLTGGDKITTGSGNDTIYFAEGDGSDDIRDFSRGSDKIHLNLSIGPNQIDNFSEFESLVAAGMVRIKSPGQAIVIEFDNGDQIRLRGVSNMDEQDWVFFG